jgi:hypothetical protein
MFAFISDNVLGDRPLIVEIMGTLYSPTYPS